MKTENHANTSDLKTKSVKFELSPLNSTNLSSNQILSVPFSNNSPGRLDTQLTDDNSFENMISDHKILSPKLPSPTVRVDINDQDDYYGDSSDDSDIEIRGAEFVNHKRSPKVLPISVVPKIQQSLGN